MASDGFHPGEPVYRACGEALAAAHRRPFDKGDNKHDNLNGKTLFITGASRGIGLAIAKRAAADGANIVIAAKTAESNPKLPGTIHSAAEEVEAAGGQALALQCDIRDEASVLAAVAGGRRRASAASTSSSTTPARSA